MTKHELLDFINFSGQVTLYDIVGYFNISHQSVAERMVDFRRAGLVRPIGKLSIGNMGRKRKVFELTEAGFKKLQYFDDNACPNTLCSCKK